jgi:hypothetical protein
MAAGTRRETGGTARRIARALLLGALGAAAPALALAQPLSATVTTDGVLRIAGTQMLANGCLSLGPVRAGAPDGAPAIANAQPVTLTLRHSGADVCTMAIATAPVRQTLADRPDQPFVIVYRIATGFPDAVPAPATTGEIVAKRAMD